MWLSWISVYMLYCFRFWVKSYQKLLWHNHNRGILFIFFHRLDRCGRYLIFALRRNKYPRAICTRVLRMQSWSANIALTSLVDTVEMNVRSVKRLVIDRRIAHQFHVVVYINLITWSKFVDMLYCPMAINNRFISSN